jgi:hypothetical protein
MPAGWGINAMAESPDGDMYFTGGMAKYREMAGYLHRQPDGSARFFESPFYKLAASASAVRPERLQEDQPLMIAGPDEVWIDDNEKLVTYDPTRKTYYDDSLPLYPDKVLAGDSLLLNGDLAGSPVREIPYSRNKLRFSFFTPYYESPDKLEYQYRLDGFDNKWSPWTRDYEAAFINLSEGDYVLWARARNIYGKAGEPVAIRFRIRPPWWRSWWAYLSLAVVLLVLVLAAIRQYTRTIAAKNRSLERKVEGAECDQGQAFFHYFARFAGAAGNHEGCSRPHEELDHVRRGCPVIRCRARRSSAGHRRSFEQPAFLVQGADGGSSVDP